MLGILLRTKYRLLYNKYIRGPWQVKLGLGVAVVFGLGLMSISYSIGRGVFTAITATLGQQFAGLLLSAVFSVFLLFLLLTGITVAFYSLFASPDLNILLAAPVPLRTVFTVKFMETLLGLSVTFTFLLFPALIGMGPALGAKPVYYPALLVTAGSYLAVPTGLGMLLIMILIRYIPVERAKEIFGALGVVFSVFIYLFTQLAIPGTGQGIKIGVDLKQLLERMEMPFWPGAWAAKTLMAAAAGRYYEALVPGAMLAGLALLLLAVCFILVEKIYLSGWTAGAGAPARSNKGKIRRMPAIPVILPAPIQAVVVKDLKIICRDLQELVQLLMPIAVIALIVFRQKAQMGKAPVTPVPEELGSLAGFGMAGLLVMVMSMFASRFSLTALARERRSIWILHASPVSRGRILWAKVLVGYLPSLLLSEALFAAAGAFMGFAGIILITGAFALAAMMLGVTAIGVLIGSIYPNFDAENPQKMIAGAGGLVYMVVIAVYVGFSAGAFILPQLARFLISSQWMLLGISLLLLYAVAAITAALCILLAKKRFEQMELEF